MKKLFALLTISTLFLTACGGGTRFIGEWSPAEKSESMPYQKVFIVGMTADVQARTAFENAVAIELKKKGVAFEMSTTHFPPTFRPDSEEKHQHILDKVHELGCTAILTMALKDVKEETRYVPGNAYPSVGVGYYGGFGMYYGYTYGRVYDPGYYTEDRTYFLESNVYDAANETLQWSAQSKTYNPANINAFSEDYASALVYELKKNEIVQKAE